MGLSSILSNDWSPVRGWVKGREGVVDSITLSLRIHLKSCHAALSYCFYQYMSDH